MEGPITLSRTTPRFLSFPTSSLSSSQSAGLALHCDFIPPTATIHNLPTELIWMIAENLVVVSCMRLRESCADMNNRIYSATHKELIGFESTPCGYESGLFACANRNRLLPKPIFADNMAVGKRAKRRAGSITRICLEWRTAMRYEKQH
jgi:hypothetical protein